MVFCKRASRRLTVSGNTTGRLCRLYPYVGHGRDFPEGAAAQRTDCQQTVLRHAGVVDQPTILVDVQAEPACVGSRVSASEQIAQHRRSRLGDIARGSGAIDDTMDLHLSRLVSAARAPGNDCQAFLETRLPDAPSKEGQLSAGLELFHDLGYVGSDAMSVNVPPRAQMAQEASALFGRRLAPQALHVRANAVDDLPPSRRLRRLAQRSQQYAPRRTRRDRPWRHSRCVALMPMGSKPSPRQGADRSNVASAPQA